MTIMTYFGSNKKLHTYSQLWKESWLITNLVEKKALALALQQLLTKSENRLETSEIEDLRLMLTYIEPDIT